MNIILKLETLILIIGLVLITYFRFGDETTIHYLKQEDGFVESTSAIFYFIGFLVGLYSIFKNKNKRLAIIWTALAFLFLGEETSWFQRILHYSVPTIEQQNAQKEFNLHNLDIFQGADGKEVFNENASAETLQHVLFNSQNIFQLGFFGYFLLLPFIFNKGIINKLIASTHYVKPDRIFTLVLFVLVFTSYLMLIKCGAENKRGLAELREMFYAFFIMLYIMKYVSTDKVPSNALDKTTY